jgi:hypothetical protein
VSVKLSAMTCGWLTGDLGYLMEGGEGEAELPIPAYLIEHPKGTALFDTGMHPARQYDPAGRVGARIAGLCRFNHHPGEEIAARLAALGHDPARIDLIITFRTCRWQHADPKRNGRRAAARVANPRTPTSPPGAALPGRILIWATRWCRLTASTTCSATARS